MAGRMTHNQMLHLYQCRLNEMLYLRAAFCFEKRLQNFSSSIHKAQLGSPAVVKKKKKKQQAKHVYAGTPHISQTPPKHGIRKVLTCKLEINTECLMKMSHRSNQACLLKYAIMPHP